MWLEFNELSVRASTNRKGGEITLYSSPVIIGIQSLAQYYLLYVCSTKILKKLELIAKITIF